MVKKKLVIANWKMYVESPDAAKKFAQGLRRKGASFSGVEVGIAPSFALLPVVAAALKGSSIKVGAQTVSPRDGAHTGEVSSLTLKSSGASFALVGHSERRASEDNEEVRSQLAAAAKTGLAPILCVGEVERDPSGAHWSFIEEQVASALRGSQSLMQKLIVAYEPVWAIGKSAEAAMKPQELEETVIFIRKTLAQAVGRPAALKIPILYGGSVEPENAASLIAEGGVNGFLVGHASAQLGSFVEILKACKK